MGGMALSPACAEVYLSLGGNLEGRQRKLAAMVAALRSFCEVTALSPLYETEPVGYLDQPWFLNAVAALRTTLPPLELLHRLQSIEAELGRVRLIDKGPRTADLDMLFYGDIVLSTPELTLPHPSLHERRFVLEPLCCLAPRLRHPLLGLTAGELLARLPEGGAVVRRLERSGWPPLSPDGNGSGVAGKSFSV
jgi:2-amino-4-hydroxy-6-hydroxymethyldihydropteridine diphosphokinase